ncbi:MAG: HAMP domain-containing sensor histidine kinase [Patescibacteria group bacterium]
METIEELKAKIAELEAKIAKFERIKEDYKVGTQLLIRRDLELSRVNEKLQKFDEIKSNFISVVAHQLRTPLSGVKWTLSMLLDGDMGPLNNEQKTFLMKTFESNTRMITLVNDMLVADGIQSGRVHYGFKHVDIIDLMDNVLFEVAPEAAKRNITITYKNKFENLPQAYIDPETMRAVLQNLLENAVKYTMDVGKIEIDVEKDEDTLRISIADNGIGIPEDQAKDVFVKFFRARNAIKQETDGSGLGLYIAKTIVERNGGKIWFESTEGKGTTFYFTVPVQKSR